MIFVDIVSILKVILITYLCNNSVLSEHLSPIYANHFFVRQFFTYFNESNISNECKVVSNYFSNHENEDWALKMIDSSGVVSSGLAKGNYQFMGDFDECLDISVTLNIETGISGINGQYCTLDLPMQVLVGNTNDSNSILDSLHLNPTIGICLPNACTPGDLTNILEKFSQKTGINVTVSHCTDSYSHPIKWIHIFIISGFSAVIILIIIGTVIETTNCFNFGSSKKVVKTLEAFSIYDNTVKLLSTGSAKDTIGCFHGFRVISLLFIILYHIYTEAQLPSANLLVILEGEKDFMLQIVTNAGLWVEAFFLLSGFLCTYGVIRELRRTSLKNYNPLTNIFHRYLRLTPSLLGIIGFSIVQELMASGPQWYRYVDQSQQTCHTNWWTNILYINNIIGLNQLGQNQTECVSFTWYLAVDMQLFLISPILIICLASNDLKKQYIGIGLNVLTILLSWIITAIINMQNGLTPTVLMTVFDLDYINKVYKQAYCRVGPYCVGILMAYFYIKYKGNIVIKPKLNLILWILSISLNLGITFLTWPWLMGGSYHNWSSVLYGATHRTLWALSWAYILFACATGHGSVINTILSWKALVPLSKLSFQAYLYHSILISRFVYDARQPIYSSKINLIMMFFQYTVLTFIVSYISFLMFEIPFSTLERLFFNKTKRQQVITIGGNNRVLNTNDNIINGNNSIHQINGHTNYGTNISREE